MAVVLGLHLGRRPAWSGRRDHCSPFVRTDAVDPDNRFFPLFCLRSYPGLKVVATTIWSAASASWVKQWARPARGRMRASGLVCSGWLRTRRAEPPQVMTSFAVEDPPNVGGTKDRLSVETCGGPSTAKLVIRYAGSALRVLSQPEHTNPDALILPRAGLAHCFTQLAEAADQIVVATTFQPG